ncbi:hypothetical protein PMAA_051330 [Paecilomyces variotii No. 5]|uniref:Acyl-protein thioesterase 1 n=1 Tax=Byssochlamys spectabilis (strain No. 5 / NBRC 109023) TaxID=1356009 RepID=V5HTJ9_BYSSN|nr:hypothetical protein PMAA_051330 [Paecilomyces variotii No. 5]
MPPKAYPQPLSVNPLSASEHTHTLILLHGRGSNAFKYGHELLRSANLPARLPTVKFVFPTARRRRSTILKRIPIHQWFDNYSAEDPNQRTDLQVEGLCETAAFLRELVEREAGILGEKGYEGHDVYSRIVLGGLSQGCAAGVFSLLGGGWGEDGQETLGAFCGMSGWLPFQAQLSEILNFQIENDRESLDDLEEEMGRLGIDFSEECNEETDADTEIDKEESDNDDYESDDDVNTGEDDDSSTDEESYERYENNEDQTTFDPFDGDSDDSDSLTDTEESSRTILAINHVRDILDLPALLSTDEKENLISDSMTPGTMSHLRTPVFLGHGAADPKISVRLGEKMVQLLAGPLDMDVTWKRYEDFGHWYKVPDEIDDLVDFLRTKIGVSVQI